MKVIVKKQATPPPAPQTPPPPPGIQIFTNEYLIQLNQILSSQPLEEVLEWCVSSLPNLHQVTSFGSTGMVILHAMHKMNKKVPVIFLDTLYHFEETLEHAKTVGETYNLDVHWYKCKQASSRQEFETRYSCNDMWISHPRRYEWLTKVEPLERALKERNVGAWITGRRRDQGAMRSEIPILEVDPVDGRIKVNPLAHWSKEEVWAYLRREGVPYNPLFDRSYASIGDSVTTAKSDASSGERSGRFHQFDGTKTECGIHLRTEYIDIQAATPLSS